MSLCPNCNEREGTLTWAGDMDSLNIARMSSILPKWCELCAVRAQVEYQRAMIAKFTTQLPEREARLAELEAPTATEEPR